jgi:hypothetical protein
MAMIDSIAQEARDNQADVERWNGKFDTLSGRGTSPAGELQVTVGANGTLTGIDFADSAPRKGSIALNRAVLAAQDRARRDLIENAEALIRAEDPNGSSSFGRTWLESLRTTAGAGAGTGAA